MTRPSVVVLGGGLAGMGAAYTLARSGHADVTLIERGRELGGLAGTFRLGGHFYPLTYHHILHRDRTLLYFLDAVGALERVRWRKIRMLFEQGDRLYNLAQPLDFLRFPMRLADKLRFVRLMTRTFRKADWRDWEDRSAAELVDRWGGPGVRQALFEPLTRLKFDLPCDQVSGAWMGARLYFREGSAPLGYIPHNNWTKVLCDGLTRLLEESGVRIRTATTIRGLRATGDRIGHVELEDGEAIEGDVFVSTLPTEVYRSMLPGDVTPELDRIRYTAILSMTCATRQSIEPDFYWLNLTSGKRNACAIFTLSSLNPTIGGPGESCLNFVTHLPGREADAFRHSDDRLVAGYLDDFRQVFGFDLEPSWTRVARLPMYSPVFLTGYRNPPVRSTTWTNVYFAGNYRTFPSIASTGTALGSGLHAGQAILHDQGHETDLPSRVASFGLP